ncbi:hypothetical protein SERLA73DRAFT_141908 [Serpula lacrymans var. lacrymans S7.3]|uniref:DUF6533 domain-containing protein n=2 Tax=Serpula lacrymans var. lacrymans TaxID=341189 RepID=F8Q5L2_SERL3|nr:uncharacterized protein SERLADRAFT_397704 [Serpula lacrymans var. lacrymans S7.9]EGN96483.1 hypothetical protein SERLA73DRAFT_141908 [Serpula lacrymans var. lacrymans S7.3]EGO22030.1 hypothetical protein SERLADRAFT_397704 [Serpula lacrymans var. lacrymans S7.9]
MSTLSSFPTILSDLQTTKYLNVAGLAIWIFDYVLSFESEIRLVWGRKWDATRILFSLARYLTLVGVIMTVYAAVQTRTGNCAPFGDVSNVFHILSIIVAEGLLIMRTYAFWQRSKRLMIWLLGFAVISLVAAMVLSRLIQGPAEKPNLGGCVFVSSKTGAAIQYSFLINYECVLLGLTMYKFVKHYRRNKSALVTALYWGSIKYMSCMIIVTLANIVVSVALPIGYRNALDTLQLVLHSILASRILFDLRETDAREHIDVLPIASSIYFSKEGGSSESSTFADSQESMSPESTMF